MADLHKYSVNESNNVALGQAGCLFEDGVNAITGKSIVAIQFLEDATFSALLPESSDYIGTANGNGDAVDSSNTFPQGVTIFGRWTGFTLASGSVIAYLG